MFMTELSHESRELTRISFRRDPTRARDPDEGLNREMANRPGWPA
jgi:hypothetical protein